MTASDSLSEAEVKHLEFIQSVISRLSTDSFLMKGWAVTVAGAIYGFAADHLNWRVATVGFVPVFAFWFLDSYFVRKERQFRRLYDELRERPGSMPAFSMNVTLCDDLPTHQWIKVVKSITMWPFYGLLVVVGIVLVIAGAVHDNHVKPSHSSRTTSVTSSFRLSSHGSLGGQILPM